MAQVIIQQGQSLMDLAVEHCGAWQAAIDIAFADHLSLTDTPDLSRSYHLPEKIYDRVMLEHCRAIGASPATLNDNTDKRWSIFSTTFNKTFR